MAPSGPSAKETQLAEAKAAKAAKAAAAKAELAEASAAKAASSSSRQSLNSEIWPMAKRLATGKGVWLVSLSASRLLSLTPCDRLPDRGPLHALATSDRRRGANPQIRTGTGETGTHAH